MTIVAIIGKPNTGKSTLFNGLIGRRSAVVHHTPNLTRDRHYGEYVWNDMAYTLIDTGGIEEGENAPFVKLIREQADIAINEADVILFVVDNREYMNQDDNYIAQKLRVKKNSVIVIANKCDDANADLNNEIYKFGFDRIIQISAEHRMNLTTVKDEIEEISKGIEGRELYKGFKFALIGKPNTGKSSIINSLLNQERMIVSDIPGTTRDAVDTPARFDGQDIVLIDTAGIRRASNITEPTEYYTILRSKLAIRRADIVVIVMDIVDNVTRQDKKILDEAISSLKPTILVFNKTDKLDKELKQDIYKEVSKSLDFEDYLPRIYTSVKTKKHLSQIITKGIELKSRLPMHFKNTKLNTLLFEIVSKHKHPLVKGFRPRFFSIKQTSDEPIRFAIKVQKPDSIDNNYKRYIINNLREELKIGELPFELNFKEN